MTPTPLIDGVMELAHEVWANDLPAQCAQRISDFARAYAGEKDNALKRCSELVSILTVRQIIEAGDDAIKAAGLNPYCMNEGLAKGDEKIDAWWIEAALDGKREG